MRSLFVLLALGGVARAESEPPPAEPPASARDVRGAPAPGNESGRTDREPGDGVARRLGRAVLWMPRLPIEIVAQPVRGVMYVRDRYGTRVKKSLGSDDGGFGAAPIAFFETGFGFGVGARVTAADLIDEERITARVGIGTGFRFGELGVSRAFGPAVLSLDALRARRDNDQFFGYGNVDRGEGIPSMPLDPQAPELAFSSRYRIRTARVRTTMRVELPYHLQATFTSALVRRSFSGTMDENSVDARFDATSLPGFADATTYLHDELEIAWDTRRRASPWDSHGIRSSGGLVLGFAGYQHGLAGEPDLVRYGIDLQRYVRLTEGPRVLQFRLYAAAVSGDRDELPFYELPRLGGPNLMRGYETGRFRDKVATLGQVRYVWAALAWLAPSLFVDVGRVHPGLDQLSLDGLRVGFGGGLEFYSREGMVARTELATSIDGGLLAFLTVTPAFDSRTERY